ncbi:MAG: hypothetical protein AAF927_15750 [Bacteroidota bacterium]
MRYFIPASLVALLIGFAACQPEPYVNPFEGNQDPQDSLIAPIEQLEPNSIEGIHARVFRPTCANSGCHDGTFEPDFRTVEAAYNTLVWHPVIKNDPAGSYTYRVKPGNSAASVLWNRLNQDIDGQSGIMPLQTDPGSDWEEKKADYLANIKAWIDGGAKDVFGNPPQNGELAPSLQGMLAFPVGNTTNRLSRDGANGPVKVAAGTNQVDLWFSFSDDNTAASDLLHNKLKLSIEVDGFEGQGEQALQIVNPINGPGLFGTTSYTHKITVDLSSFASGNLVYVRVYVKENAQASITEIPTNGSANYTKAYFSMERK